MSEPRPPDHRSDGTPGAGAEAAVGVATPRRWGVAFLGVLGAGLVLALSALLELDRLPEAPLASGEWTAVLQEEIEEALPIYEPALQLWTAVRLALFAEGGPGVVVGEDGWLFTEEELALSRGDAILLKEKLRVIEERARAFREREIPLVIALLPAKARIYEDRLPAGGLPRGVDARLAAAGRALREISREEGGAPLLIPDLLPPLEQARAAGEQVFLRTDTHWTPAGAAVAARAIAAVAAPVLRERGVPARRFETRSREELRHRGDLLRFLPLGPFAEALAPAPERILRRDTRPAGGGGGGLFDDPSIPVTLVGTSYSAGELWNFRGFLAEELQADVLNLAEEGRGPFAPMRDYLAGQTITEQPPELVIWEIPERYLTQQP